MIAIEHLACLVDFPVGSRCYKHGGNVVYQITSGCFIQELHRPGMPDFSDAVQFDVKRSL